MFKTISKVQSYIKSCCRLLSSEIPKEVVQRSVRIDQNIVYGGDVTAPTHKNSFGSLLFSRLMKLRNKEGPLQVCESTKNSLSARNFLEKAVAVARRLQEEKVKKGDTIALVGDNSLNLNVAVTGIFFLGAVPAPVSTKTKMEEFENLVKSVQPKMFFLDRRFFEQVKDILDTNSSIQFKLFFLSEEREEDDPDVELFGEFIGDRGKDAESFKPAEVEDPENELALVMRPLTEGAAGRLVGITHHNINSLIARLDSTGNGLLSDLVILMVQKMAWISGLYSFFISTCHGAKLILMSKFDEERFMEVIEEYKVTFAILFSAKVWQLYKHEYSREYDVSSIRHILTIDGNLALSLILGMKEKFGISLRPCYGTSELTGLVLDSMASMKLGSTGKLALGFYGKVVSEKTSQKVGPYDLGIICFKGPTLTKGYINDQKSTQALFDKEGFLVSEMLGYYDEEGFFHVIDRIHNVIKHKNCEISPRELEGIIRALPQVRDVVLGSIQHPNDGYWPLAIVVLRPKAKLTAEDIIKHVEGKVEDCKRLRAGVIFVSKIPRSKESGGIKRYLINRVLSKYRIPADASVAKSDKPTTT